MNYKLAEHVSLTQVDDEAVILDLNTGAYFGLNHVGAEFLAQIANGDSVAAATKTIAEQYQIDQATVVYDIEQLLKQLLENKLISAADQHG